MARSRSSQRWLAEHFSDEYVKMAQERGFRSRAVFKLEELDARDRLFKPAMSVVDLGAAPGGWSQYAAQRVGKSGRIIALDILPMEALPGVTFIQGDFQEDEVLDRLMEALEGRPVDLVLSDMAPNMTGARAVDQPRAMYLAELALDTTCKILKPGGVFVVKLFHGAGFDEYQRLARASFASISNRKPKASRDRSAESYMVAKGLKKT
ncbi:23S rRNA (uridine(2552)-2'-O)-methyltransferase RlmE [Methylococcus sp. EFPC2]|uniref:23S rRNA (uridine(2552)-2'-O)-methyltransferase RlmE n=1 Tax=Methylococcus sp. EFPC2 TaxID=2812648 RepID=UPI0019670550|nr:23S rRNA (uridine(2552)-2'-O)-methyltransferase RlmE [Methylococcus sp. EFPC2]QSA98924.1 23S rRNA (uridine(2552)-2'-O)-methyltransferase RlmE [Methylococcus sp. EFPC2]